MHEKNNAHDRAIVTGHAEETNSYRSSHFEVELKNRRIDDGTFSTVHACVGIIAIGTCCHEENKKDTAINNKIN
jgi:hypothetical protein